MSSTTTSYEVHLGFWTNWSHGKFQGATVTLTRQHGGFLIAFLAIFIGMVGKSFWRLGCFALHRYFSSADAQDGLYHQRQAILRNSDTAQDGAWRLLMSMFAWRSGRRARRPILRLLPIIVAAFTISAAFGVASIFSSNVTSETLNQVLLKGTRCGSYSMEKANSVYKQLMLLLPANAEKANRFLNYGMQCYTNESHTDGCNLYIKPRLQLTSKRGIPCPFGDNICKLENDNLLLDTGMIDSLKDFGINSAPNTRFQFRMVHKCAPLKTQGYYTTHNDSEYGAQNRYMYGKVHNMRQVINWTYEAPVDNAYVPGDNSSSGNIPRLEYSLGTSLAYGAPNGTLPPDFNDWVPIPALTLEDADVHLLFMSAPQIHYAGPVHDPWFSATRNASELSDTRGGGSFDAFLQDEPVGVMACTQQIQYCNPNLPEAERCEPLRGIQDPRQSARVKKLFPSDDAFATIKWATDLWSFGIFTISATVGFIGASALRARYGLSYGYSGPLPDNQWQLEAEHWIKGTLASLQDVFVEGANGIPEVLEDFRQPPLANETIARNLCQNQKIVSTSYSSFNVLGLSLILILGTLIIILDVGLEPTVAWWQRRRYTKLHSSSDTESGLTHPLHPTIEWSQTSTLQLQRYAHEAAGYGEWSGCDKDVPVTQPGQLLGTLDLSKTSHPLFAARAGMIEKGTPASDWEDNVMPFKPWGVRRSETGLDTLVEEGEERRGKEKEKGVEAVVHLVDERRERRQEKGQGLGVNVQEERTGPGGGGWRELK